ncbi:MAG: exopolysaccharide biosynthesis protein [Pseudomonadota bacterium]|nr:exopolysaccharide biosynthesis protein [Pseudomonadota bacterium]
MHIHLPHLPHGPRPERTTDLLLRLVAEEGSPRLTINDLIAGLGDRAFGLMILLFALPNCVPAPPGIGSLLGLPIFLFSIQLMRGKHRPWLPRAIGGRSFSRSDIRRVIVRAAPVTRWFEAICKPRLRFMTEGVILRLVGFLIFLLSALIILPFPGTNWLPGVTIAILSIGLIERDGLIVLGSSLAGLAAFWLSGTFFYVGLKWALGKLGEFF